MEAESGGKSSVTAEFGGPIYNLPLELNLYGHDFVGWFTTAEGDGVQISDNSKLLRAGSGIDADVIADAEQGNVVLYARFTTAVYKLSFFSYDGEELIEQVDVEHGTRFDDVAPTAFANGAKITQWSALDGGQFMDTPDTVLNAASYYAYKYQCKITIDYDNGGTVIDQIYDNGKTFTLPYGVSKSGNHFAAWIDVDVPSVYITDSTPIVARKSTTYRAVWQPHKYTVVYHAEGESFDNEQQQVIFGNNFYLSKRPANYDRETTFFVGWKLVGVPNARIITTESGEGLGVWTEYALDDGATFDVEPYFIEPDRINLDAYSGATYDVTSKSVYFIGNPEATYTLTINVKKAADTAYIYFENVNIVGGIYLESGGSRNIAIVSRGTKNSITAPVGKAAISGFSLEMSGGAQMTISGGNGANASVSGGSGGDGAAAIVMSNKVVLQMPGLVLHGGNGGDGRDGANGRDGRDGVYNKSKHGESGGNGANGGNGGKGGNGAPAIVCGSLYAGMTVFMSGGDGGNAGAGGNGGRGGNGANGGSDDHPGFWTNYGFNGGNGGRGGDGGDAGDIGLGAAAYKAELGVDGRSFISGTDGIDGEGANGGNGGNGGRGGERGDRHTWTDKKYGDPGWGGDGGRGGNSSNDKTAGSSGKSGWNLDGGSGGSGGKYPA